MKKKVFLQLLLFILFFSSIPSWSQQDISEEARRYFNRGLAAVEIARTPADYNDAIREFEKAKSLAPNWPDVYYNLGLLYDKVGKYKKAIENLKQYLWLAPNVSDAEKVREYIYKLEYKAENVLTISDIVDVLVSFAKWQKIGKCAWELMFKLIKREGFDRVRFVTFMVPWKEYEYSTLKVEGPIVKFTTKVRNWVLDPGLVRMFGREGFPYENQIEVVSLKHVIVKQKVTDNKGRTRFYSCEYVKE